MSSDSDSKRRVASRDPKETVVIRLLEIRDRDIAHHFPETRNPLGFVLRLSLPSLMLSYGERGWVIRAHTRPSRVLDFLARPEALCARILHGGRLGARARLADLYDSCICRGRRRVGEMVRLGHA